MTDDEKRQMMMNAMDEWTQIMELVNGMVQQAKNAGWDDEAARALVMTCLQKMGNS